MKILNNSWKDKRKQKQKIEGE